MPHRGIVPKIHQSQDTSKKAGSKGMEAKRKTKNENKSNIDAGVSQRRRVEERKGDLG